MTARVTTDGKQFTRGADRFTLHGVTYGTFEPQPNGARFPDRQRVKLDFAAMCDAGFNVVRTYTEPTDDVLECAADSGVGILAGVFYEDWRYMVGGSRRQLREVAGRARSVVAAAARRLSDNPDVIAVVVGNEVPADVIRWVGHERVSSVIRELVDGVHDVDPHLLVTYANYPTAEYLTLDTVDFLTFNVFLEQRQDYARYLTRLQHLAGSRPLVLGEVGMHAGPGRVGEERQAEVLDWQLETALERGVAGTCIFSWTDDWWVGDAEVEGWRFGLTDTARFPRPALDVAERWNRRTVGDLDFSWPSISVVVCAYNAEATLDECLDHTCALDYPDLEVILVDDGSTDGTADIVARHPRAHLLRIPHGGLATARNEGLRAASGDLIAYLDSDAYPSPEWLHYLALGLDGPTVAGVGGPNVPPPDEPPAAQRVARAPGGPAHVLLTDDRAEHIPGCNMAFWRDALVEVGGFDPVFEAAGDDVDLCWRVLDRGHDIGFHPAALVWHRRRAGTRAYLRQQRGYGRSEALVEARHPNRFNSTGTARWRGVIYGSSRASTGRQRIYRGVFGTAAFQSVYRSGGDALDIAHQVGVPLAVLLLTTAPLGAIEPVLALPAALALVGLLVLGVYDASTLSGATDNRIRARITVAFLHLVQPIVRLGGRVTHRGAARRELRPALPLPSPVERATRAVRLLRDDRPRAELLEALIGHLRAAGVRTLRPSSWEEHDVRLVASTMVFGDVSTSSFPVGWVQLRLRHRPRVARLALVVFVVAALAVVHPWASLAVAVVAACEATRGVLRTRCRLARVLRSAPSAGDT